MWIVRKVSDIEDNCCDSFSVLELWKGKKKTKKCDESNVYSFLLCFLNLGHREGIITNNV